jgi:cyanoexosortase A
MPRSQVYLLSGIGLGLILLHLLLTWRFTSSIDQLLLNVIFWGTIVMLIYQKRHHLPWQHDCFSSTIGSLLMGLLLCKSISLFPNESEFIRFFPSLAGLALALLASGWKVHRYGRELAIVLVLMIPPGLLGRLLEWSIGGEIQILIAQSAAFLMHYVGINLVTQGTEILLKQGAVRVEYACTGIPIWILLGQLASLLVIGFRLDYSEIGKIFLAVTGISWLLATIRVIVMANVIAQPRQFDYWHGAAGGQIFSTIAIVLFALFCQLLPTIAQAFSDQDD